MLIHLLGMVPPVSSKRLPFKLKYTCLSQHLLLCGGLRSFQLLKYFHRSAPSCYHLKVGKNRSICFDTDILLGLTFLSVVKKADSSYMGA